MKIYTRTGDDGATSLLGGRRISKSDKRIAAMGAVDELNAALGTARASQPPDDVDRVLAELQDQLFRLGAELARGATDAELTEQALHRFPQQSVVDRLEETIDAVEGRLPPLGSFILPGGTPAAAQLHQARCICRRAERAIVILAGSQPVHETVLKYINRVSDLLFVLARATNQAAGTAEQPWNPLK